MIRVSTYLTITLVVLRCTRACMHACDYSLTPSQSILNAPRAARLPNCIPLDTSLMAHALEALSGAVVSTICRTLALDYVGPQHGAPPPLTCSPAAPLGPCALAPSPSAPRAARRDSSRSRGPATRCGTGSWPGSTCSCAPERRWTWRTCRSGEPPTYGTVFIRELSWKRQISDFGLQGG